MYMNTSTQLSEDIGIFNVSRGAQLNPNMVDWLGDAPERDLPRILGALIRGSRDEVEVIDLLDPSQTGVALLSSFKLSAEQLTGRKAKTARQIGNVIKNQQGEYFRYYLAGNRFILVPANQNDLPSLLSDCIEERDTLYQIADKLSSRVQKTLFMAKRYLKLATTDKLTGLLNRHGLERGFKALSANAARNDKQVAVMFIDLDRFKSVNDTYGHKIGDQVIKFAADIIQNEVRAGDLVGRYGGEEILVCGEIDKPEDVAEIANKIRIAFETTPFVRRNSAGKELRIKVTISSGVASYNPSFIDHKVEGSFLEVPTIVNVIKVADKGVYAAKRAGRNRVFCHDATNNSDVDVTNPRTAPEFRTDDYAGLTVRAIPLALKTILVDKKSGGRRPFFTFASPDQRAVP